MTLGQVSSSESGLYFFERHLFDAQLGKWLALHDSQVLIATFDNESSPLCMKCDENMNTLQQT